MADSETAEVDRGPRRWSTRVAAVLVMLGLTLQFVAALQISLTVGFSAWTVASLIATPVVIVVGILVWGNRYRWVLPRMQGMADLDTLLATSHDPALRQHVVWVEYEMVKAELDGAGGDDLPVVYSRRALASAARHAPHSRRAHVVYSLLFAAVGGATMGAAWNVLSVPGSYLAAAVMLGFSLTSFIRAHDEVRRSGRGEVPVLGRRVLGSIGMAPEARRGLLRQLAVAESQGETESPPEQANPIYPVYVADALCAGLTMWLTVQLLGL